MTEKHSILQAAASPVSLDSSQLYRECPLDLLAFATTNELEPLADQLGQDRVIEALDFGFSVNQDGFNIFLLGSPGLGKRELLESLLAQQRSHPRSSVEDWCYVNNFNSPDKPIALRLPRGMAMQLRDDMSAAVEELLGMLPATFQADEYHASVQDMAEQLQKREQEAFQAIAEKAAAKDLAMVQTPSGYTLAPAKDGEIVSPQDFEAQPEDVKKVVLEDIETLKEELKLVVRQLPAWRKESRDKFKVTNAEFSRQAIDPILNDLKEKYRDHSRVLEYLDRVHHNIIEEAEAFTRTDADSAIPDNMKERVREFPQYSVNVMVDNSGQEESPVIYEDNPSFGYLIGRCEHVAQMGALVTDFTLIKPGALHRANGGYLVLEADKVLTNPYAWMALKRALRAKEIRIQSLDQMFSLVNTEQLEPEAVELDVKLVLTGSRDVYFLLQEYDPEFASLFRVTADMSEDVDWDSGIVMPFARLIRQLLQGNNLLPCTREGVARTIEHAARQMQDSLKLSLHREQLSNLLVESDFIARRAGSEAIGEEHVSAAIQAANHRLGQFRDRVRESILREIMLVQTAGSVCGQVNGLSVYLLGNYSFGRPSRITATARLGAGKVLDIEREVDLGGKIHSKAVLIIGALLAQRYAREQPLPVSATLVFEQSYGGIEGDSASIAEYVALISALAEIPVRQELAVTGSLNQQGEVQAIGGVNEKVEGFYDICCARGLSGGQGVVIPAANVTHLMVNDDVRKAVKNGDFHVYSVSTVDEALELLTGYSADSIDALVQERVRGLNDRARDYAGHEGGREAPTGGD